MDLKKAAWKLIGIILVLIVILTAYYFLTTGTLKVSASSSSTISVLVEKSKKLQPKKIGVGKGSVRLKPGTYQVSAVSGDSETRTLVEVAARRTTTRKLEIRPVSEARKMVGYKAQGIVSDGSKLLFLNRPVKTLYEYLPGDSDGEEVLPDLYPVARVTWLSFGRGVAELYNSTLHVINGVDSRPLLLPPVNSLEEPTIVSAWAVNKSGQIALLSKKRLYFYDSLDASPRLLMALPSNNYFLALSDKGLLAVYKNDLSEVGQVKGSSNNYLLDQSGKKMEWVLSEGRISFAKWSPDGTKAILAEGGELKLYDAENRSISTLAALVPENVSSTIWFDNNSVLIIDGQSVLLSQTDTKDTFKILSLPGKVDHPEALYLTPDKKKLYFSTTEILGKTSGATYEANLDNIQF